jgi:hypothetical protein
LTTARTGRIGKGKISVHHVADAIRIRIRNEEHAEAAILTAVWQGTLPSHSDRAKPA